jgi:hypothetical protein
MHDTVFFQCPRCTKPFEVKPKSGNREGRYYQFHTVPIPVADGILGTTVYCSDCGINYKISQQEIVTIHLELIRVPDPDHDFGY